MKKILIIGAGPNQMPAIEHAKQRGYKVFVTDMNPEAVGIESADGFGLASTRDPEKSIEYARKIHETHQLDGVMTMASESSYTVACIAKELNLPGLHPDKAFRATHKVQRQEAFRSYGVPSAQFDGADSLEDGLEKAERIGWPVVVKPADSAGSRGVRKVESPNEMADAVKEIRGISTETSFLIEEFMTGTEHSIEGIVIDGEVTWTAFSDRNYDKKEIYLPYFLEDGDSMPSVLEPSILHAARQAATDAVRALEIDWGPVKGDILIAEDGPKMIEMATRLSGDYFCYETTPLHNGINLLEVVMDLSVGQSIDVSKLQPTKEQGVALRYIWPNPGRVTAILGLEEARAMPGVHFVNYEPNWEGLKVGDVITPSTSMGDRVGCVMTSAETREEAIRIAESAVAKIRIITEEVS